MGPYGPHRTSNSNNKDNDSDNDNDFSESTTTFYNDNDFSESTTTFLDQADSVIDIGLADRRSDSDVHDHSDPSIVDRWAGT
jgi:hypothetical protein